MKIAFFGGIKSGKSRIAEEKTLEMTGNGKPIYLATNELFDDKMKERIRVHKLRRNDNFITIEEPVHVLDIVNQAENTVIFECVSMWINNMLHHDKTDREISDRMKEVLETDKDIVFVQNEVGLGIIPPSELARNYMDISGEVAQLISQYSNEVYFCVAGLAQRLK